MERETFQDLLNKKMEEIRKSVEQNKIDYAIKKRKEEEQKKRNLDKTENLPLDKEETKDLDLDDPKDKNKFDNWYKNTMNKLYSDIRQINAQYPKK